MYRLEQLHVFVDKNTTCMSTLTLTLVGRMSSKYMYMLFLVRDNSASGTCYVHKRYKYHSVSADLIVSSARGWLPTHYRVDLHVDTF